MQCSAHKKFIEKVLKQRLGRYFTPPTQLLSLQTLTQTRKKQLKQKTNRAKFNIISRCTQTWRTKREVNTYEDEEVIKKTRLRNLCYKL